VLLALWIEQITIGDAIVGGGTLALAAVTAYLGVETRATAKAARESVETAEEPFVIPVATDDLEKMVLREHERRAYQERRGIPPFAIHRSSENEDSGHFVRLRLWNTGMGPAVVCAVELLGKGDPLAASYDQHPLPTGLVVDVEVPSARWEPAEPGSAQMRIEYTHADGRTYATVSDAEIKDNIVTCLTYERERARSRNKRRRLRRDRPPWRGWLGDT
jgi:hypothetical protein